MAFSGTISTTQFDTTRVIDTAFRRCRLNAQAITSEMLVYAKDALYLLLSELANGKPPSWCIEKILVPMYEANPRVVLPVGTVEVLNANYRVAQEVTGATTFTSTEYTVDFGAATALVNVVGVKWSGTSVPLTLQVSDDGATWTAVGTQSAVATAGEWTWMDLYGALPHQYFRLTAANPILATQVFLGNSAQEIPLGVLNRDTYTAQSSKFTPGRPVTFWFQRDAERPVMNLWPAPNLAAETAQLVVWRHRHIMDVGSLAQSIEVPQRWMNAIIDKLAAALAAETPSVDANLVPMLEGRAAISLQAARDGDNDGSPTFIQPRIACYTR